MLESVKRAIPIHGYMTIPELEWLAEEANKHKFIIEVGCLFGRSTVAMALNTDGYVWVIDNFYDLGECYKPKDSEARDLPIMTFLQNVIDIDNISIFIHNHEDLDSERLRDADMVFIDGSHDYDSVKRDISKWISHKNLLLCGHDIDVPNHPGVTQAVKELVPDYQVAPGTAIWYKQL